ncbi:MAG: c-type cytochrome [Bacteroidetes bacterium]|nr:c-type cytochrome [Bacteroidota bacterium]
MVRGLFAAAVLLLKNSREKRSRALFAGLAPLFLLVLALGSCRYDTAFPEPDTKALLNLPPGFESPDFPEDNALTQERWELGKRLFYEPALSVDSSISCASCHAQNLAFSDGRAVSLGVADAPGTRNAPTLTNVAYHPYFMREGGVTTLEMQVGVPIQEHAEFNFNFVLLAERLSQDESYQQQSRQAYNRKIDPFVISRAIATFERTLISGRSAYDRFLQGENSALDAAALHGKDLFFSERTSCSSCHAGFDLTAYAFENNGLYTDYADPGRARLTGLESDRALFKVPTLRNIAVTAPYMHDGSLPNLEAVVAHYRSGGQAHPNKSALIRPLDLTDQEAADLLAFLQTLTDHEFLADPKFQPE